MSGLGLESAKIVNNLTDQKVNMSATITLHCDVVGTPIPKVVWTKNNHTVVEGSGEMSAAIERKQTHFIKFALLLKTLCTSFRRDSEPAQPHVDHPACKEGGQWFVHLHCL